MRTFAILVSSALLFGAASLTAQDLQQGQTPALNRAIHRAIATHYASLLRGAPLPDNAHAIWFIADDQGNVVAHGVRASLPSKLEFKAIPAILPELNGRPYRGFTVTSAASTGPAQDVEVLWVVLGKV
jgi:hypothetical protein